MYKPLSAYTCIFLQTNSQMLLVRISRYRIFIGRQFITHPNFAHLAGFSITLESMKILNRIDFATSSVFYYSSTLYVVIFVVIYYMYRDRMRAEFRNPARFTMQDLSQSCVQMYYNAYIFRFFNCVANMLLFFAFVWMFILYPMDSYLFLKTLRQEFEFSFNFLLFSLLFRYKQRNHRLMLTYHRQSSRVVGT